MHVSSMNCSAETLTLYRLSAYSYISFAYLFRMCNKALARVCLFLNHRRLLTELKIDFRISPVSISLNGNGFGWRSDQPFPSVANFRFPCCLEFVSRAMIKCTFIFLTCWRHQFVLGLQTEIALMSQRKVCHLG